jgi:cytochrome o ubiquinol oxidase subunit IV
MSKDFIVAPEAEHSTFKLYLIGFTLSLLLTLAAYFVVTKQLFTGFALVGAVWGLGLLQAIVQLLFFMHLGRETKPHWNMIVFLFMLLVLCILVFGSLWIMYTLDYNVMSAIFL